MLGSGASWLNDVDPVVRVDDYSIKSQSSQLDDLVLPPNHEHALEVRLGLGVEDGLDDGAQFLCGQMLLVAQ